MSLFLQFPSKYLFLLLDIILVVHHHFLAADAQKLETDFPAGTPIPGSSTEFLVELRMKNALPTAARLTQCTGFVLPPLDPTSAIFVTQIKGYAPSTKVHHLALYGCTYQPDTPCACPVKLRSTLFVSAKNTPAFRLPLLGAYSTNMQLGGNSNIQYVFLEVHYLNALSSPDSTTGVDLRTVYSAFYLAGIYSIMGVGTIEPGRPSFTLDTCVTYTGKDLMYVLGYQVHTHSYGTLVSVYGYDGVTVSQIGRGNPQFPQAFYPYSAGSFFTVNPGDRLMLRCVYDTTGLTSPIYTIGVPGQSGTEMCFVNLLYSSTDIPTNPFAKGTCDSTQSARFPASSTTLITPTTTEAADKLRLHALYGNQTGIVSIDSSQTMNLDLETFT